MSDKNERFDLLSLASLSRRKKQVDKKYARFNRRMLAATIDSLLLMVTAPLFNRLFPIRTSYGMPGAGDPEAGRQWIMHTLADPVFVQSWLINTLAQTLIFCVLSAICWHFWSATPGKKLLRLKIVDATTGEPISDRQCLFRASGYLLSGAVFFLGFFWIAFDKRRQGWHDKLAQTVVIVRPWRKSDVVPPAPSEEPL